MPKETPTETSRCPSSTQFETKLAKVSFDPSPNIGSFDQQMVG
jgi:hypothetical protein